MNWNVTGWNTRDLVGTSLIIFIVLLVIAIRTSSQTLFLLSEAALSVVLTLGIVEIVIRKDRERQWERVRVLTYTTILSHLSRIALTAAHFFDHSWGANHTKKYRELIKDHYYDPKASAATAIIMISKIISYDNDKYHFPNKWDDRQGYEEYMQNEAEIIEQYYKEIEPLLNDIRIILIPRVLQLSSKQEVNETLLDFEDTIRLCEDAIRDQESLHKSWPIAWGSIPFLLIKAGVLYDILQYELHNSSKTSLEANKL